MSSPSEFFSENKLFLGVGLAVGSCIISNLGLNLQKLTHVRLERRRLKKLDAQARREESIARGMPAEEATNDRNAEDLPLRDPAVHEPLERIATLQCPYYLQPLWLLGLSFVVAGAVADFSALGFADQIIIAPIGSMTLVTNLLFAPFFSNEKLSKLDVLATIVIVCGCVVAVIFARPSAPVEYTMDSFLGFYGDPRFLFYVVAIFGLVALVFRGIIKVENSLHLADNGPSHSQHEYHALTVEATSKSHPEDGKDLLHRLAEVWWGRIVLLEYTRFGYASISGVTGAQSVMFAKAIAVTVVNGEWEYFEKPLTYVILVGLCISVWLQLKWSNKALQHFDALYVVPVFQAFWIGFSIISGMIVYQESQKLSWLQLGLFSVGIMITMTGIYILSQHAEARTSKDRVESQRLRLSITNNRSRRGSLVEEERHSLINPDPAWTTVLDGDTLSSHSPENKPGTSDECG